MEEPCVPIPWMDTRATASRVCPRVELDDENFVPGTLCLMSLSDKPVVSDIAPTYFESATFYETPEKRAAMARRVYTALNSDAVSERLSRDQKGQQAALASLFSQKRGRGKR
jgi:hypothetical protein